MARVRTVSDSVDIPGVTPQQVYEQISDPTRMGRWSPENTGAVVERGEGSLVVGDVFVGTNARGGRRWHTRCEVTVAEPGARFAFDVVAWGLGSPRLRLPVAGWEYRLEPVETGTRVTETWTDHRGWPDAVAGVFDRAATGGRTFAQWQQGNISRTLARLRDDLATAT